MPHTREHWLLDLDKFTDRFQKGDTNASLAQIAKVYNKRKTEIDTRKKKYAKLAKQAARHYETNLTKAQSLDANPDNIYAILSLHAWGIKELITPTSETRMTTEFILFLSRSRDYHSQSLANIIIFIQQLLANNARLLDQAVKLDEALHNIYYAAQKLVHKNSLELTTPLTPVHNSSLSTETQKYLHDAFFDPRHNFTEDDWLEGHTVNTNDWLLANVHGFTNTRDITILLLRACELIASLRYRATAESGRILEKFMPILTYYCEEIDNQDSSEGRHSKKLRIIHRILTAFLDSNQAELVPVRRYAQQVAAAISIQAATRGNLARHHARVRPQMTASEQGTEAADQTTPPVPCVTAKVPPTGSTPEAVATGAERPATKQEQAAEQQTQKQGAGLFSHDVSADASAAAQAKPLGSPIAVQNGPA